MHPWERTQLQSIATSDQDYYARSSAFDTLVESDDRAKDRRQRYIAHLGWWLLAIAFMIITTCSCAGAPVSHGQTRNASFQQSLSARIEVLCVDGSFVEGAVQVRLKGGSGTLMSKRDVLTASHVVTCKRGDDGKKVGALVTVAVDGPKGMRRIASAVVNDDPIHDVAHLRLFEDVEGVAPPVLGKVKVGDEVCQVYRIPTPPGRHCGKVVRFTDSPDGDIVTDIPSYPGNSGGGMYNKRGQLVGVVIQRYYCSPLDSLLDQIEPGSGKSCGGGSSSRFQQVMR